MTDLELKHRDGDAVASNDLLCCPECGEPLRPIWHGMLACFCTWGGRQPTVAEIVDAADAYVRPWH